MSVVDRLPDATVHLGKVKDIRLRRNAGHSLDASAAKGTDVAPAKFLEELGVNLRGSCGAEKKGDCEDPPDVHAMPPRNGGAYRTGRFQSKHGRCYTARMKEKIVVYEKPT